MLYSPRGYFNVLPMKYILYSSFLCFFPLLEKYILLKGRIVRLFMEMVLDERFSCKSLSHIYFFPASLLVSINSFESILIYSYISAKFEVQIERKILELEALYWKITAAYILRSWYLGWPSYLTKYDGVLMLVCCIEG